MPNITSNSSMGNTIKFAGKSTLFIRKGQSLYTVCTIIQSPRGVLTIKSVPSTSSVIGKLDVIVEAINECVAPGSIKALHQN